MRQLSSTARARNGDLLDLTLEGVLLLVEDLTVGPVRDVGLLDSAVRRPSVSVFGRWRVSRDR